MACAVDEIPSLYSHHVVTVPESLLVLLHFEDSLSVRSPKNPVSHLTDSITSAITGSDVDDVRSDDEGDDDHDKNE